jgi:pyruvate dehydrogenase E2 component (dihydrolipoyllysine-residue acetyltransferase)
MSENMIAIKMPKWGMSMATGKVVEWLKEEGAVIGKGDELLEVETEKIINTFESNDTGILSRRVATEDEELPVGALLGVICQDGVADDAIDAFIKKYQDEFVPEEIEDSIDNTPEIAVIGEMTIAYRKIPASNNQNNRALLFIHGFGGDQNSWLFNIAELGENHSIYTLDLPGHGASSKQTAEGSLTELATTINDLMESINLDKAHIVGHSLGAAIAVELAKKFAKRVASLTLLSGAGEGTTVNKDYVEGFIAANRRKEMKPYLQQLFADSTLVNRDMVENVLKAKRIEGAESCLRTIADVAVFGKASVRENLSELTMPIQVIWGKEDLIASVKNMDELPNDISSHIINDAGHMVHMEAASEVNALINNFVDE